MSDALVHFRRLAERGSTPGCSSGEARAHAIAAAVVRDARGLDSRAVGGACEFVRWCAAFPIDAAEWFEGLGGHGE